MVVDLSKVYAVDDCAFKEVVGTVSRQPNANRIEKWARVHRPVAFFERTSELTGYSMNTGGDGAQSFRSMIDGEHGSHHREEDLSGADIAGGLFTANMLLARLQGQA